MRIYGEVNIEILEAAKFFAEKMLTPEEREYLDLEINWAYDPNDAAECVLEDDDLAPRCFAINLHPANTEHHPIQALAHEMVHVRQYVTGQLRQVDGTMYWNDMVIDMDTVSYFDLPWEIEAHQLEEGLFEDFLSEEVIV